MIINVAEEFYQKNKTCTWNFPKLPKNLSSDLEIARWLLNESNIGWLELDLDIDVDSWKKEIPKNEFVDHRGKDHPGWNSCCIHGIDVDKTGAWTNYGYTKEEDVPYRWTDLSEHTPIIKTFWQNFPYEKYRRIRFMQLEPSGYISPHSDAPGKLPGELDLDLLEFGVPINVAIVHPDNCFMTLENNGIVPFQEGKAFMINIRNYHSFINFSDRSRIHLIAHGIPGTRKEEFANLITRSYFKQYEHKRI